MNKLTQLKLFNKSKILKLLSIMKVKFNILKDKIWFRCYLNNDEFSPKLDLNAFKMAGMTEKEKLDYVMKITKLRDKAHNLDLEKN